MKTVSRFTAYVEVPVPDGVTITSPGMRGMEPPVMVIQATSDTDVQEAKALVAKLVENVITEATRA